MNYMPNCDDCHHNNEHHHKNENKTIVKCGLPYTTTIPKGTVNGTAFTVASFQLNSTKLCNPTSMIKFNANVTTGDSFASTITFQLYKRSFCNPSVQTPVGSPWISTPGASNNLVGSFFICDNGDCAEYTIVATLSGSGGTGTAGTLSISNANLKVITTSNEINCCCC